MGLIHHRGALLAALLLASFCVPLLSGQGQDQAPAPRSPHRWLDPTVKEEYKKWLREDVAWIITDEERADFKSLLSDKQRDEFVIAFWERRNPTPGAPENKFKEEHYQRIAYTNQHFASGSAGWKTDRGRIYIVYGPPDEIKRHPSSAGPGTPQHPNTPANARYPYEVWHYRNMKGIRRDVSVEFVDICECGDYRLTVDPSEKEPPGQKD